MSQLFIDFEPPAKVLNIFYSTPAKPKLPPPRRVNRTRLGMLVAAATFDTLSDAEQRELDAALGAEGVK